MKDLFEMEEADGAASLSEDFYRLYKEELKQILSCGEDEVKTLLAAAAEGNKDAKKRVVECHLSTAATLAEEYQNRGLPMGDLVQEANMALLLVTEDYVGGDFKAQMETGIRTALEEALEFQDTELRVEEEMAARVNVLNDISTGMAKELGREATVEELAERMKMTPDEIRDIMKLTLDAMSVSGV